MPKVDGISLISFIREINPTIPIVVFTGVGYDEEKMHAALRAGANGYMSKNLPIEQLYSVLSRVLATCQQGSRRETPDRPQKQYCDHRQLNNLRVAASLKFGAPDVDLSVALARMRHLGLFCREGGFLCLRSSCFAAR